MLRLAVDFRSLKRVICVSPLIYSSIKEDYMPQQNYLDELTPGFYAITGNKRGFTLFIMSRCAL
ncbi:oxidoreductase [Salmonella enterica subsp. enterica]|uniref:Oxidoreductase n=1 Tax=Salmonella enterica I TaxID=59201 RepID=A0A447TZY0_SALET|nr:oxidoreductase [Salmonella enterica subsp. enterica]